MQPESAPLTKPQTQAHPEFVQPESARNEILQRLEEPLRDLSVSRTSFDWGIPVPADPAVRDNPDAPSGQQHVMYVWFDALTNYLSGSSNAFAAAASGAGAGAVGAGFLYAAN